jgi:hypothetical protein
MMNDPIVDRFKIVISFSKNKEGMKGTSDEDDFNASDNDDFEELDDFEDGEKEICIQEQKRCLKEECECLKD